jgi:hypothetical protein
LVQEFAEMTGMSWIDQNGHVSMDHISVTIVLIRILPQVGIKVFFKFHYHSFRGTGEIWLKIKMKLLVFQGKNVFPHGERQKNSLSPFLKKLPESLLLGPYLYLQVVILMASLKGIGSQLSLSFIHTNELSKIFVSEEKISEEWEE